MIYLDNAASTQLAPEISDQLASIYASLGNPQSSQQHHMQTLITDAKAQVAGYINADKSCIHFTSGASESIASALIGGSQYYALSGKHIITFETEHNATLACCKALTSNGFETSILPVRTDGALDINQLKQAIRPDTILVSINHVCNETGLVQDLDALFALREQHGFMIHIDASQSVGKTTLDLETHPADFVSLSAHKAYGPQGVGASYIAATRHIKPLIHGTHNIRSGTPPVALIQMMGMAYSLASNKLNGDLVHIKTLRQAMLENLDVDYEINGTPGVPHILNLYIKTQKPEAIAKIREAIYCQQSASCHNGANSHVLKAHGHAVQRIQNSIRFSFGRYTTLDDVVHACTLINTVA